MTARSSSLAGYEQMLAELRATMPPESPQSMEEYAQRKRAHSPPTYLAEDKRGSPAPPCPHWPELLRYGSEGAAQIDAFLMAHLARVKGARKLWVHRVGRVVGQIGAVRPDSNGRMVYPFYMRGDEDAAERLSFRRNRAKYPYPRRRGVYFFPAPVLYAQLHRRNVLRLPREEFYAWTCRLIQEADVADATPEPYDRIKRSTRGDLWARYPLPWRPPALGGDWSAIERTLGRRLSARRRYVMVAIWALIVELWTESTRTSRSGLPCAVRVAVDGYLTDRLRLTRWPARQGLDDLIACGFIVRAIHVASAHGRGHYRYLPGDGVARCMPRHIEARHAINCMRRWITFASRTRTQEAA